MLQWWLVNIDSDNGLCHQETSHYLSQCWSRFLSPYGTTWPQCRQCIDQSILLHPLHVLFFLRCIPFLVKNLPCILLQWSNWYGSVPSHLCMLICFMKFLNSGWHICFCPACRTTFIATRFRVAVICPIIPVPHCIRVFFYFVWFVFINHIFQFYYELCTYCNILDIYLS